MKLIIDIDENLYKEVQNEVKGEICVSSLWRAIADGTPVECEKPFITKCRDTAIEKGLPLYFVYYEETGVIDIYITATDQLFEKRHTSKHLLDYEFRQLAESYINAYYEESL